MRPNFTLNTASDRVLTAPPAHVGGRQSLACTGRFARCRPCSAASPLPPAWSRAARCGCRLLPVATPPSSRPPRCCLVPPPLPPPPLRPSAAAGRRLPVAPRRRCRGPAGRRPPRAWLRRKTRWKRRLRLGVTRARRPSRSRLPRMTARFVRWRAARDRGRGEHWGVAGASAGRVAKCALLDRVTTHAICSFGRCCTCR